MSKSARVVERDLRLLKWLNGHWFVLPRQVGVWMGVHEKVAVRRLRKLEALGLLKRDRVFVNEGAIVRATKMGCDLIGDDLGAQEKLRLGSFEHDRDLVDLSLRLEADFPEAEFVPERRIRQRRLLGQTVGVKGRISDGVLLMDGAEFAIELELSRKPKWRLRNIVTDYQSNLSIKGVWYFCSVDVFDLVKEAVGSDGLFKIERWEGRSSVGKI